MDNFIYFEKAVIALQEIGAELAHANRLKKIELKLRLELAPDGHFNSDGFAHYMGQIEEAG